MSEEQGFQLPTPTEHHQRLKPFEGTFDSEVQMWIGPGDPMVSTGKMKSTFQVGDLFLHQDYKSESPLGPFGTFEGRGYWGFNTTTGQYEGFWIDTASTTMQMEKGSVDETGKVFEMHSEFVMHGATMKKRTVFTVLSNDHHRMEAFIEAPGAEEMKSMSIEYKRS
ncbi:MAG: DUF1579 family protein [Mariniblastus sp.]